MTPRPASATIRRPDVRWPPVALAAGGGICPDCDAHVDEGEELMLRGQALVGEQGDRRVDLSDAEWVHLSCPVEP